MSTVYAISQKIIYIFFILKQILSVSKELKNGFEILVGQTVFKTVKILFWSITQQLLDLYLHFDAMISGVSWGVHSVRLHPGWPQGGAKKWPKGASKRGRRKEGEREEGGKRRKGEGKEKEKRKEKGTKKRKGDINWKERDRKIKKVTNGKRFKRKKL